MSTKHYHNPVGDPCIECGGTFLSHIVSHKFVGKNWADGCEACGLPYRKHKPKERQYHNPEIQPGNDYCLKCDQHINKHRVSHNYKGDECIKRGCTLPESHHKNPAKRRKEDARWTYIGIDGEGRGRKNHKYVMLAASTEDGEREWHIQGDRLSTEQCLDLILALPNKRTRIFSYSFNYDLTKMLEDLDDETLYKLFRPGLRPGKRGPRPMRWGRYLLNLQGTKFTVKGKIEGRMKKVVIWDLFKFFQGKFITSLKDWRVGNPELWERMSKMKDKRAEFDKEKDEDVLAYCLEECRCMAELGRRLIEAHEKAGLKLRAYYGAGSSGGAMLSAMGIRQKIKPGPVEMNHAVASAFFGGRFENSVIGEIKGTIYDYDIASAYPYQCYFLPCLEHGRWEQTNRRKDLEGKRAALVRYGLEPNSSITSWGPFPFRTKDGSICFPQSSGGGWVWLDEYLAGERHFPNVYFKEAWTYTCDCDCRPFERIAEFYVQRLILGKEGPGIVIKLGCNSCYGKLAQSVGSAIFNSWIWAGMITSGTRAMILDALAAHQDWSNLLTIATDGIKTRERLKLAPPRDTGTFVAANNLGKSALGEWEFDEKKTSHHGLFVARPGIYFPLNPTIDELKHIKGRGVGKGTILENWHLIVDAWKRGGLEGIATVANISRFCGAKTSISKGRGEYNRAAGKNGKPAYGQWVQRKVEMGFNPLPKRAEVNNDGITLRLRRFSQSLESSPYDNAVRSQEAKELLAATQEILEQPDADLTDYEVSNADTTTLST